MKINRNDHILNIIPENKKEYDFLYEWWINGIELMGGGSYTSIICKKYVGCEYDFIKRSKNNTLLPVDTVILEEVKRQNDDWGLINMSKGVWKKQYILDNWDKDTDMTDSVRHIWLVGANHFATNNKIKQLEKKIKNAKDALTKACENPLQCGVIEPNDTDCAQCEWYPVWKALGE